jgi:hypothetical protein
MLHGSFDCATAAVAEDDDEGYVQFRDGVLDAALDHRPRVAHHIAGYTHDKDVAHPDIEQDLRGNAGVGTADDHRLGILAFGESAKLLGTTARTGGESFHEARVSRRGGRAMPGQG